MASVTMSSLASKYDDFMVPALKVKASGVNIVGKAKYEVESVEVSLSQDKASSAVVRLTNVYDPEEHSYIDDVSDDFILGTRIEIEMGYGSKLSSLFYGYVVEIQYELSQPPSVSITAMDVRSMMMGNPKNCSHKVKSYSDAFSDIMKPYKVAYKSTSIDKTDKLDVECIIQNAADFEYITEELCRKADREFFVHAGVVYFKKDVSDLFKTVEMEWAKDLINFQRRATFQDTIMRIQGQNSNKKEAVQAEVKIKSDDKQKSLVTKEIVEQNADVDSMAEAKKIADYKAEQELKKARQAKGSCIGIPEILPGGHVKIKNGDRKLIDGTYYIVEAKHSFNSEGYLTTFEVGGWSR